MQQATRQDRDNNVVGIRRKKSAAVVWREIRNSWRLYVLLAIPIIWVLIFKYLPMYGVVMAFQDYNMFQGVFDSPFVGLAVFREMFAMPDFFKVVRNTLMLNFLDLVIGFPAPLLLAIIINELRIRSFKRVSQSILYFPHFLSWVIIGGMTLQIFSPSGVVNNLLSGMGMAPVPFLTEKGHWLVTYILIGVWQNAGWGTIIYLAAISGINEELFDAAAIDGAGRFRSIWHVLLPAIRPTIIILLILSLGRIVSIGFDRPYVLQNPFVLEYGEVISTYVYKVGMQQANFSLSTAVGLFQSLINIVLLVSAEFLTRRAGERGIW